MTRLIRLVVTVPADDEVTTEHLQATLRQYLEAQPTARVGSAPDAPRIHWPAVDVRRLVERPGKASAALPRKLPPPTRKVPL